MARVVIVSSVAFDLFHFDYDKRNSSSLVSGPNVRTAGAF